MSINDTRTTRAVGASADAPPRPLAEIAVAALAVGCAIPSCAARPGTPCDSDSGAVHLARISLACRARHVTGREFTAVILSVPGVFRPATLIRAEEIR